MSQLLDYLRDIYKQEIREVKAVVLWIAFVLEHLESYIFPHFWFFYSFNSSVSSQLSSIPESTIIMNTGV